MSSNQNRSIKLGRPVKPLMLPETNEMTVNDIWALNPHIICRLSIYTKVGKLVVRRILRKTGRTTPSAGLNEVGKPLDIYQTVAAFRRSKVAKQAARTRAAAVAAVA